ncbi:D-alanyl-D-alanine carboxypeptidase [Streptomyces sp. NPDC092370]|uniref:D-alanyl-D-alanine carboxypeptidase n=1 Tax=Streptomyces sp. NPDC092370 TaxID=3366016 RepID=UPI003804B164
MAGESPDRSKQRESSARRTSGSASPVPEARSEAADPRLAVARDAEKSSARGAADTATRVLSTRTAEGPENTEGATRGSDTESDAEQDPSRSAEGSEGSGGPGAGEPSAAEGGDGRLRDAVAAWVASADGGEKPAAKGDGEDAEGGRTAAEHTAEPTEADTDEPTEADTDGQEAGKAAGVPEAGPDAEDARTAGSADGPARNDAHAGDAERADGPAESGTGTDATGRREAERDEAPQDAVDASDGADEAEADRSATHGSVSATATGEKTGDKASRPADPRIPSPAKATPKAADAKAEPEDAVPQDAPEPADAKASAKDAEHTPAPKAPAAKDTDAEATPKAADAKAEPEDAVPHDAPEPADAKASAKDAEHTPAPKAPAAKDTDAEATPKPADAKAEPEDAVPHDAPEPADDEDAGGKAAPEPADGRTAPKAPGAENAEAKPSPKDAGDEDSAEDAERTPASKAPDAEGAAKAPAVTGDAPGDESGATKAGGAAGSGTAPASDDDAPAEHPVDQPTAVFKAVRPPVDQPTTMLKLGGGTKDAPEKDAERTSKFVALKPLDEPAAKKPVPAEATAPVPTVGPERTTQQPLPPKPPLDLLAELTNTPPPPETPLRTAARRVKIWTPLVLLLVVVFAVVQSVRPLPTPTLELTAEDSYTFEGGKVDIPWPTQGQAALDVQGIGTFGSSGEQKPVPIASVAKVMTAYLVLREHPLKSGEDGPKIPIDQAAQDQSDAGQESTVDVTKGDKITEREALESILIASANNVARLLARWDAGSEKAFVRKMNDAAEDLGMKNTTYTDPSGLNNTTVSTAVDQVKLARAAMQQPVFREVATMMSYVDYKGKKHDNWNRLVGYNDVTGIKTGTTTSALGNLVFAARKDVNGETHRIIGAVVRQPAGGPDNTILGAALHEGDKLIRAAQGALESATILKKGEVVGYADDGLGGRTPVAVTEDVTAVGWAGLSVKLTFARDDLPHTAKAGTKVGTLTVGDGTTSAVKVPVALQKDLVEPGFAAKLTRIG